MWPPPLFVSFTVLWFCNFIMVFVCIKQSRTIRRMARERDYAETHAFAAIMFANAIAERGGTIPCDDCGNLMDTTDEIDVLPRPDGKLYVGHRSHNRRTDWGLVP